MRDPPDSSGQRDPLDDPVPVAVDMIMTLLKHLQRPVPILDLQSDQGRDLNPDHNRTPGKHRHPA